MSFNSQDSAAPNETFGKDASFKLEQLIGSMSISPSGRDVVLASKEGLHIIDLDSPYSPPRYLPHRTTWEVADVQWSPFADRDHWVVSTSNQKALVWNLNAYGWRNSIEHVLHGHTRAITDINFSAHHPDKLATCAVDSFVHCWDLRCPARPVNSFSDWFASATQVKWSRQDEHVVASSHDKFLHIWDDRKGAYPARTIEAHNTKIYGIDWNRFEPSKIVTCSLDRTIKFWDTDNDDDVPDRVIETSFPVWRARHTPFGWGLMVMPQRGNGDLHLYDRRFPESGRAKPVHIFPGHKGQVKEFLWRAFGTVKEGIDHRDFQLVSWGTDRDLRLHAVSENIFEDVGYEKGASKPQRLRFTRRGARYRTFRDEPTEQDAALTALPRADSFPANNQFLRVKGRSSTNMGMSRVPVTQFKGWLQAGQGRRRVDMHGRGAGRPDKDPISWMKNVKIASWDTDALADEITIVGEKFKKVDFEDVSISQRKATMSLQSPSADLANASMYTRLEMRFPKGYPKDAQAIVHVQRTNLITTEIQKQLSSDIHKIAEAHKLKGRGCIEAIVRYLLREQSLQQILAWIMRDSLTDSKIIEAASMSQDLSDDSDDDQVDAVPVNARSGANINVPLAKGCAGLWAESGKLVCFFKPEDKEPASLLSALGTGQLDESESGKLFGGFGKFQVESPSRRVKDVTQPVNDDSASETSDQTSIFSSSTSSTDSSANFHDRERFAPWQRTTIDSLQRGKSTDGSQKSTVRDSTRSGDGFRRTLISIHDLSDLLPVSQTAAQAYTISGSVNEACSHNYNVAVSNERMDASRMWQLAYLITKSTSLAHVDQSLAQDSEIQVLRSLVRSQYGFAPGSMGNTLQTHGSGTSGGQTNWIPNLMQFCEKIGDIQTLALLSAIYLRDQISMLSPSITASIASKDASSASISPISVVADMQVREEQFPSSERAGRYDVSLRRKDPRLSMARPDHARTSVQMLSTSHPGYMVGTQSFSQTPNVVAHDPSGSVSTVHSSTISLASSPERHRLLRNAGSQLSSAMAPATLHDFTLPRPRSPPNWSTRQDSARSDRSSRSVKASPDHAYLSKSQSGLGTSLGLANISMPDDNQGAIRKPQNGRRPILKHGSYESSISMQPKKRLRTKFCVPMQAHDDRLAPPYISSLETYERCLNYIGSYLPLLEVWRLWVQRAEMIKICAQMTAMIEQMVNNRVVTPSKSLGEYGLQIRRCCLRCGNALAAIEKNGIAIGWHCTSEGCSTSRSTPSTRQRCVVCELLVRGLSVPCLRCGHFTCYDCAQGWFVPMPKQTRHNNSSTAYRNSEVPRDCNGLDVTCPAGCGCHCSFLKEFDVPVPTIATLVPDVASITTPTAPRSEGYQENGSRASTFVEHRKRRGQSIPNVNGGVESAVNALLALNSQSRHRSTSSTTTGPRDSYGETAASKSGQRIRDNSISVVDELLPWAADANATLGRGVGGGLSRGLGTKGSDSTMRRADRKN